MGTPKGINTFESFQLEKQVKRQALVAEYLRFLQTSRVQLRYVTDLAEMVAKHITQNEGKPCNRATLLRNPRYKSMLLSYMASNLEGGTKHAKSRDISDPKVQAMVMTAQVESGNLKRENERLRAYVAQLEAQLPDSSEPATVSPNKALDDPRAELYQVQLRFARICMALHDVIRHLEPALSLDMASKRILDMSRIRNNVVVDSDVASSFFDWLEANRGIGSY